MGFLLVFFPEEDQNQTQNKPNNFNLFSIKRTNSFNLIHRAQSTISICLLLVFTTLLLFTLSTLPRNLRQFPSSSSSPSNLSHALQGMGTLYRRGTRAMNDVVVAHAHDSLSLNELKLFLRLFFRSSLASKSDLLLIFPSKTPKLNNLILQEHDSFFKLLTRTSFDVTHFTKMGKKERESGEPIWGQKTRTNYSGPESNRLSYGSVVGFDVDELDSENSLSGFVDHVPMSLRRWACYPMLLGRVRRNFKHVMLVDVKDILLLGDPLGRVATSQSSPSKHGKRNSDKTESTRKNPVHPGIVMGGSRGVRRLSNAMLTDIVRASIQHKKKKNSVTESGIFNQLIGNDYALKNVNLIVSTESLPELSSLGGSGSKSGSHLFTRNYGLIKRGNSNLDVVNSMMMKHICSFPIDAAVYSDCFL
ncbi:hypothetical protein PHJA_001365900 [Phtheirospermum japonicum]|uniref:DUF7780 domain-containing protein n=1 Tax=Phtheirospermum japonicum TaxID=374723 RepID=A0A830C535_9LAMI|nr:hypothetical protein PHJA_001365900 [Phtheirospermum japonicum]